MLTRRQFLWAGAGLAGAATAFTILPYSARLLSASRVHGRTLLLGEKQDRQYYLAALNLGNNGLVRIAMPFMPHSYVQDPQHSHLVWAIEKWGPHAALVDLQRQALVRIIEAPGPSYFFGHGFFYPGTRTMFFSYVSRATLMGSLLGIDSDRFDTQQIFDVARANIHQSSVLPDGTLLVASNGFAGGEPLGLKTGQLTELPSLVHCDPLNGRVLNKLTIRNVNQYLSHFALLPDDRVLGLALGVSGETGRLFTGSLKGSELTPVDVGADVDIPGMTEMLSVAIEPTHGRAVVTAFDVGRLLLLDTGTMTYQGSAAVPGMHFKSVSYDSESQRFLIGGVDGLASIPFGATAHEIPTRVQRIVRGRFSGSHTAIITV